MIKELNKTLRQIENLRKRIIEFEDSLHENYKIEKFEFIEFTENEVFPFIKVYTTDNFYTKREKKELNKVKLDFLNKLKYINHLKELKNKKENKKCEKHTMN